MISDAVPETVQRVVLVEEVVGVNVDVYRWQLTRKVPVDGDQAAADAHARKLAMEYLPEGCGESAGRRVFRASDGSWLVEVTGPYEHDRSLVRITTAEQVHVQEYVPPARPKRRFFG